MVSLRCHCTLFSFPHSYYSLHPMTGQDVLEILTFDWNVYFERILIFFFSCLSGFNDSCLRTLLMICLFLYNYFCYKETAVKFLLWIFIWGKTSTFFPHVPWTVDLYVARRPLTVHQAVWYLLIISLFDNQGIIPWFQSIEASFLKELSQVEEAVYLTDRPAWLKSRFLTWNIILLLIFSPNQKSVLLY